MIAEVSEPLRTAHNRDQRDCLRRALRRKLDNAPHVNAADVIPREAERMARCRISANLTRYEPKSYVAN